VLWAVVTISIESGNFQHLAEQKPIIRSKQIFLQLIKSAGPPIEPKLIMVGWGVAVYHMGEIFACQSVFFRCFVRRTHSRPRVFESHIEYINRCGFGQGSGYGGLIDTSQPMGELTPQNRSLWGLQ
jgi:hypothetical protein